MNVYKVKDAMGEVYTIYADYWKTKERRLLLFCERTEDEDKVTSAFNLDSVISWEKKDAD